MLRLDNNSQQNPSLWESVLPRELSQMNEKLTKVDKLLDDERTLAEKVKKYLEERHAAVVLMAPEEHDELISIVLGLSHFIALVYADTLVKTDKLEKASMISGTTFKLLLTLAESVLSEDADFYASLQMALPGNIKLQGTLSESLQQWRDIVSRGNRAEFIERMSTLKNAFADADPNFTQAYGNMYKLG